MVPGKKTVFAGMCLIAMLCESLALDLYVAPERNGDGSREAPLPGLAEARDALRASAKLGKEPCTVWIRDGIYRIPRALRLDPRDGGSKKAPVVWRAINQARGTAQAVSRTMAIP